ncbi:MAG: TonB-dependent receptor plug domain-containing protein, partial [Gammaproteobacteria bacterium]
MNYRYYALFALAFFSINNFAQDVEEVVEENTDENVEEVVTTGSRIARDPLESAQPITILDGDMIRNMGLTAASALTDLPEVDSVASISGDQGNLGAGQSVASNFGLNSSRTVTLVNGRRYVGSQGISAGGGSGGAVNLANVPTALIDRIEVVPVGGAAIYGADAIAGVVNFVLKDDFEGAEFTINNYDYAGMDTDDSFNLTI